METSYEALPGNDEDDGDVIYDEQQDKGNEDDAHPQSILGWSQMSIPEE